MTELPTRPQIAVIIEDDPNVRTLLDEVFQSAGFKTILAETGLDGIDAVETHQPSITTLDINLPGIDGFETARRIRNVSDTYIVMVSALADESDVVLGLASGADDYLVKPFRPRELRARIEALLRRPRVEAAPVGATAAAPAPAEPALRRNTSREAPAVPARNPSATASLPTFDTANPAGKWSNHRDLSLNMATRTVLVAQREVVLTESEFGLLATLLESKRRVRSKSDLALVLRGGAFSASYFVGEPDKRAIEAHIATLRRKIGDNLDEPRYIEDVRGVGYRLTPQSDI